MGSWNVRLEAYRTDTSYFESYSINPTSSVHMKISFFPVVLLVIATIAISYLAYHVANNNTDTNDVVVGIGSGVSILLTLGCVLGLSLENDRQNVNLRAWGIIAFIFIISVLHPLVFLCHIMLLLWRYYWLSIYGLSGN